VAAERADLVGSVLVDVATGSLWGVWQAIKPMTMNKKDIARNFLP
jgi:hypothetical protein